MLNQDKVCLSGSTNSIIQEGSMAWQFPLYSKKRVDAAGKSIALPFDQQRDWNEWDQAYSVMDNWRRAHHYPLNAIQANLRYHAKRVCPNPIIAQRIKRYVSIRDKLRNIKGLKLSQMQDIGGCRAVLDTVGDAQEVVKRFKSARHKHGLLWESDYINEPKVSGYRSHHLIFEYRSDSAVGRNFNGQRIEVQIRSQLQHVWSTAVETVGTFTQQALKSSLGSPEWLRFFALMGTVFANMEGTPRVDGTPENPDKLKAEIRALYESLGVQNALSAYNVAITLTTERKAANSKYRLITLNFETRTLSVREYASHESRKAFDEYSQMEQKVVSPGKIDAVLVIVDSVAQLKKAYPNYNLDMRRFVEIVGEAIA